MPNPLASRISVIGYECGIGGCRQGCDEGPRILRERKLVEHLRAIGHVVHDGGNANGVPTTSEATDILARRSIGEQQANNLPEIFKACSELSELVTHALEAGSFPLVLGGDHSLSIGSVAAVANVYRQRGSHIGLIWIDTHADINTPQTSITKNLHGMPVSILLGQLPGVLASLQAHAPAVDAKHLAYVGLRELDASEKVLLRKLGIQAFTMKDIDMRGIGPVMEEAIAVASAGTAGFVASFDLDVCEPAIVPGTGTPKRGGLTFREAHLVMELLYESKKCLALEVVELNPSFDIDFTTADLAVALCESACGKTIL